MKLYGSGIKNQPSKDEISRAVVSNSGNKYIQRVLRLEDRDNRGFSFMKKELMQKGFLLLDSSYTQAANPNSMRDFGPNRNVIYNMVPLSDHSSQLSNFTKASDKDFKSALGVYQLGSCENN